MKSEGERVQSRHEIVARLLETKITKTKAEETKKAHRIPFPSSKTHTNRSRLIHIVMAARASHDPTHCSWSPLKKRENFERPANDI